MTQVRREHCHLAGRRYLNQERPWLFVYPSWGNGGPTLQVEQLLGLLHQQYCTLNKANIVKM